jgi:hypothetical protein
MAKHTANSADAFTVSKEISLLDLGIHTTSEQVADHIRNGRAKEKDIPVRADIVLHSPNNGPPAIIDLVITHNATQANTVEKAGQAAARMSNLKKRRYKDAWELNDGQLLPLAFETSGLLDKRNEQALRTFIIKAYPPRAQGDPPDPHFTRSFYKLRVETSVALNRSIARALRSYRVKYGYAANGPGANIAAGGVALADVGGA